jgi:hypothetical protein
MKTNPIHLQEIISPADFRPENFFHQPKVGFHMFGRAGDRIAGLAPGQRRKEDQLIRQIAKKGIFRFFCEIIFIEND